LANAVKALSDAEQEHAAEQELSAEQESINDNPDSFGIKKLQHPLKSNITVLYGAQPTRKHSNTISHETSDKYKLPRASSTDRSISF
jgi:hypothetical protein